MKIGDTRGCDFCITGTAYEYIFTSVNGFSYKTKHIFYSKEKSKDICIRCKIELEELIVKLSGEILGTNYIDMPKHQPDRSYLSVSNCCGANADYDKPMKKHEYLDGSYVLLSGICSKCDKETNFYDKTKLVVSKHKSLQDL